MSPIGRGQPTLNAAASNGRLREILDNSANLFIQRGYDRVSVEEIANASGLQKATLYHYVKSKDDILVLLHREFMQLVLAAAESPGRASLDPESQLRLIMADILGLMKSHRGHVRVFFEHHRELPAGARKPIIQERDRYQRLLENIITAGVKKGQFRRVDARLVTLMIFGACNWAYQWYSVRGRLTTDQVAEAFADLVLRGIGADAIA
jgi:TetR/AcrR family transcriptional regulator, cholesterol catabolism regulator